MCSRAVLYLSAAAAGAIAFFCSEGGLPAVASITMAFALAGTSMLVARRTDFSGRLASISVSTMTATMTLAVLLLPQGGSPDGHLWGVAVSLAIGTYVPAYVCMGAVLGRIDGCIASLHFVAAGLCSALTFGIVSRNSTLALIIGIASLGLIVAHLALAIFRSAAALFAATLTGTSACALTIVALYTGTSGLIVVTGLGLVVTTAATLERVLVEQGVVRPPSDGL
ncbi:hypothetical protein WQE_34441 [Paraburkholderia hospita]|uniref:Uncharacterized protein n=1 Tax=Paraburkholderia hospita TaxID=169430 RepID=A0ABN0FCG9_9BURK|nr:hypothetical protein WQE_34441 [Paraburkholderia hospita]